MRTIAQLRRLLAELQAVLAKEPPGPAREQIAAKLAAVRREMNERA